MSHRVPDDVNVSVNSAGYSRADKFVSRLRALRPSPRPHHSHWLQNADPIPKRKFWKLRFNPRSIFHWLLVVAGIGALCTAVWLPAVACFIGGLALAGFFIAQDEFATSGDLALLEDIEESEQFLAHVDIFQLTFMGSDRGVIWIEDNALHFCGSASSFVLGTQDFSIKSAAGNQTMSLSLKGQIQTSWIVVRPLRTSHKRESVTPFQRIRALLDTDEPATIPRQWPPFTRRQYMKTIKSAQKQAELQEPESLNSPGS